jgi:L-cystine uptake protein TcyP (sodium:dicarboxylate symporter family)
MIYVFLIIGMIFLIIAAVEDVDTGSPAFMFFGMILLIVCSLILGIKYEQKKAIKAGVAEWVQIVDEFGGVDNEFRYITQEK